jgi:CubicO group peptidase (beta-lactamase class C family)
MSGFLLVALLLPLVSAAQPGATTELSAPAITVWRNQSGLLPLQRLDTLQLATVLVGDAKLAGFATHVGDYLPTQQLTLGQPGIGRANAQLAALPARLHAVNLILLALPDCGPSSRAVLQQVMRLHKKVVVMLFSYKENELAAFDELHSATAVLAARGPEYKEDAASQAAQVIFGGRLAREVSKVQTYGFYSTEVSGRRRLAYGSPASAGLRDNLPARVDSLLQKALAAGAFPGAQVIIARHGVVALRKNYGVQAMGGPAFGPALPVTDSTLYDFASLTKIMAALPALMRLQDLGLFGPDYTMGTLFDFLKGTDKQNLHLRDVLAHQARLKPFIPFWQGYVQPNGRLQPQFFQPDSSMQFPLPVGQGLWGSRALPGRIYQGVATSPLNAQPGYVYSDFSFMLYPYYVQRATGQPFDQFLRREIYAPLGATTLGFNPLRRFPLSRIAPTEYDSVFRKKLVHGTVHDENAAMLSGVSGHAGLFGTANDLAKLVQLFLWQGRYGGQQLIRPETLAEYTACQFCPSNRRGLGFDKPDPKNPALNAARSASPRSYGHTGFTGTYFWVEPDQDLFVILLTNRVNPTRRNGKLGELGVRSALLQLAIASALPGQ